MKKCFAATALAAFSILTIPAAHAVNLLQIYQQAVEHDMTYQNAKASYEAARYNLPINLGPLLPQISLAGDTAYNKVKPNTGQPESFNTNSYTLTLTQTVFDFGKFKAFTQSTSTVEQAAITFALAQQTLVQSVAIAYFRVLLDETQVRFAEQNEVALKKQLEQTEQQYKVGIKALTDVQSTKASYESAVATRIANQNNLDNDLEALAVITGRPERDLASLKQNFPLVKPKPANPTMWVNYGLQHNLQLKIDQLQTKIEHDQIWITFGGGGSGSTTPGFLPKLDFTGTIIGTRDHSDTDSRVRTETAQLGATLDVFNGGETYATMKQDYYTYRAAIYNAQKTRRTTISNIRQNYLNVLSDISQTKAFKQAIISGQSSLAATRAAYEVGTRTIVDLLTEQSNLFNSQQQYAQAIFQYISNSLALKLAAGSLSVLDIKALNHWLKPPSTNTVDSNKANTSTKVTIKS